MSKLVFIQTLGCAMNVRDSEHMIAQLSLAGYSTTKDLKEADLILINTCSVREKPVHKLFSEIGYFNSKKKAGAKIGVCGCSASHLGEEIFKRAPYVDFVIGARNTSKIIEALNSKRFLSIDLKNDDTEFEFGEYRLNPYKALINIMIGCDKKCSYCIVPYTRGYEVSIPSNIIIDEAKKAVDNGAVEIFLLGQNVNNYGKRFSRSEEKIDFSDLLIKLSKIDNLKRIRFTSPHPLHMDDKFLEVFSSIPQISKSIHMPLQSGSSKVLKDMKRGYTKEWFINRANRLRELCSDTTISTDIIVAYPTETKEDFDHTMDVIKEVRFEQIYSFKYSPRPHTPAAKLKMIDDSIASSRLSELQNFHNLMLDEITNAQNNKIFDVLFDEIKDNKLFGKSDNNFTICVDKNDKNLIGQIKKVKITMPRRLILNGQIQE